MNRLPTPPIRVLLVDDQPIIHEAIRQMLADQPDIELRSCLQPTSALDLALTFVPAVVLLDIQMEPLGGLDVLDALRAQPSLADVSVVMLSSAEEPAVKVDAFRRGANDYLVKLPSALELVARLRSVLDTDLRVARTAEIEFQRQRLELLNHELAESALTDPLTGLRNRRYLRRLLGREHAEGQHHAHDPDSPLARSGPVSLYLLDLDHFKQVNDNHGHDAGDAVLIEVARRLVQMFPQAPAILRWGGEELLLLLPGADVDACVEHARRIMLALAATPVQIPAGDALHIRCSMGFAPYPWTTIDGTPGFSALLTLADAGVYLSKQEGRNRSCGSWPGERPVSADDLLEFARDPLALHDEDGRRVRLLRVAGPE